MVGIVVLLGALSACARPVGDFGRAGSASLNDDILPATGKIRAELAGEAVSTFNLTDEEREMRDRVWRFLVAPHANDWFMDTVVELQRTRLVPAGADIRFDPARYYRWLRQSRYESSNTRYRTLADHIRSDVDTMPATFAAICRVVEIDRQRGAASRQLRGLADGDVAARRIENSEAIAWFTRAVRYRYQAYSTALDNLLVETPHAQARDVDSQLGEMSSWVEAARRGDFCQIGGDRRQQAKQAIPARVLMPESGDTEYRK